jgi:hypothetical protein
MYVCTYVCIYIYMHVCMCEVRTYIASLNFLLNVLLTDYTEVMLKSEFMCLVVRALPYMPYFH